MRIKSSALALLTFLLSAAAVFATQGISFQTQLGNPSSAATNTATPNNYLIERTQYVLSYNNTTRESNWVSWSFTSSDRGGTSRTDAFAADPLLPGTFNIIDQNGYKGSGYDRGHMCPSADRTLTVADNEATFFMTNMIPQTADNNQGIWNNFEGFTRDQAAAAAGTEILIISGPSGFAGSTVSTGTGVAIPGYTWKIAVIVPPGSGTALSRINAATRVIAIKVPNISGIRSNPWTQYVTSARQLQTDTGYSFFTAITDSNLRNTLLDKVDGSTASGSPVITTQPVAQSAAVGGSASFTVAATDGGNPPLSYQWFKGETSIDDATTPTLSLTNLQAGDAATYSVTVTNSVASVSSNAVALVITGLPPVITAQPVAKTANAGTTVTFSVSVTGTSPFTYQWRKIGAIPPELTTGGNISGAATDTLTLTNVQAADAASYEVVISNGVGTPVTSTSAALTVTPSAPTIVTQPVAQSVVVGSNATFTVAAIGTAPLTYQWRKGTTNITGNASSTSAALTITGVLAGDAATDYNVVVSNGVGTPATSNSVALSITTASAAPVIISGYMANPLSTDGNFEYVQLVATQSIDFATTPYSVIFSNNGTASTNGWKGGGALTYGMTISSGSVAKGDVFYVGGSGKLINGTGSTDISSATWLRTINIGTTTGDGGLGATGTSGVIGNGGSNADGIGVFKGAIADITSTTVPVDAVFFGTAVGGAKPATGGYTVPTNDHYIETQGVLGAGTNTFLYGDTTASTNGNYGKLTGTYDTTNGAWTTARTSTAVTLTTTSTLTDIASAITLTTAPAPTAPTVASTTPAASATGVSPNAAISVTFSQAVTVSGTWFTINSTATGTLSATVTGGPTTFTLTPPTSFAPNDTITVTLVAAQIKDQATGTLSPTANTTFSFTTAALIAPSIATQPTPQAAAAGSTATFTVVAAGTSPFSYQWRKGTTPITGNASAATATLTLGNVQAADAAADFNVVVSNGVGTPATSNSVALTVTPAAPTIVTQPIAQTVATGSTASFTVAAIGTAPLSYQWRKDTNAITGNASSTTATLTLTNVQAADAASYDVVVSNGVGTPATSNAAVLTLGAASTGQVIYAGGSYNQDFNTLPSSGTIAVTGAGPFPLNDAPVSATGTPGWFYARASGTGSSASLFQIGAGAGTSGAVYSFGADAASDRALGTVASGSTVPRFGVILVNNTGATITQFILGYTGEQWRRGSDAANKLTFEYGVGATDLNSGTFVAAPGLDFTAPVTTGSSIALDGNLAANRTVVVPVTITGLAWASGQTLVLRWSDTNDAGNDDALAIDDLTFSTATAPLAAPTITTPPVAQTVNVGDTATFNVVATGSAPLTYQWRKATAPITGNASSTTATLTLVNAQLTDAGSYDVVISNGVNPPATSTPVNLTVNPPVGPSITTPPTAQTADAGATATFTVVATGSGTLTYQWRKAGTPITGNTSAATATLTLANVQADAATTYDVVVTNTVSSVTSTPVALTVTPVAPTVTTPPVAVTVGYGANATFTVAATGSTPFTYVWRKGGTVLANGAVPGAATISGATGATLTLTAVTAADAGNYDVIVSNTTGAAPATTAVALTVNVPPAGPSTDYVSGTYAQNFDTLPTSGTTTFTSLTAPFSLSAAPSNATGMAGWSLASTSGTPTLIANAGTTTNGAAYSYGTGTATDRALGSQGSGSTVARFGVALVNKTTTTLTQVTIGYTGEQWRRGSGAANVLAFSYGTGAIDLNTGVFTNATALDFTAPVTTGADTALDGNLAANRTVIAPVTITGLNWAPNTTLTLRWTDTNDTGNDDGISIDDLTFTAAPNILTAPVAQNVITGGTATFTVATNASPVTYQWRKNGTAIAGNTSATTATLTLPAVTTASAGNYDVVLTNAAGSTTTTAVALNVATTNVAIAIANTSATYDGTPKSVTVTTTPAGFPVTLAYAGSATAPTDAGSYVVTAAVSTTEAAGNASALLTIAKATQTVTLGALPATVSPGVAFTLNATASSGLPVTLSVVSGNATISGNSVTLTDTAAVTLRATQSGNNNYNAATADTTVTAGKLTQTIAVTAIPAQLSTAAPIALNATATSGLPVTFALVSGPATLSGNVLTLTGAAGTVAVRASQAGNAAYNPAPDADLSFAVTVGTAAPRIATQPSSQVAQVGGTAAFSVVATGSPAPTYQWRKDGVTLAGATAASLALANLTAADSAGYDVVVTNSLGSITSSLARLTVNATPTAPVITRRPGNVVALAGRSATFTVAATGSPAPTYLWSQGPAAISGATTTSSTLTLASVTAADAGTYTVTVTNSAGTASASATLRVIARSYAGTYFGTLGNGGRFALRINDDNTGVFLGFVPPGSSIVFVSRAVTVDDNGHFSFVATTNVAPASAPAADTLASPRVAAASGDIVFEGSISDSGALTSTSGSFPLSASRSLDTGATAATAGFYQAGATGTSAQTLVIVSPAGQAFVLLQNGANSDAGSGTADATGKIAITTAAGTIAANVTADTAALTATVTTGGTTTTFTGYAENSAALAQQRIINISTRTTAGTGDQVAIVGFVIAGLESKPVLIRAVGPALRGLGVTTALAAPHLDLRGATGALLATNTAWGSAGNTAEIANAAARSGAFPLAVGSADSVILTTLAPGAYSAVISASDNLAGVGLVEVYDLSGGSTAQKLANLSTRAAVGSGEATLISGLVVGGTAPKRVLIRAAGPSLAQFGVANSLTRPALVLYSATGAVLAQNSGWTTSADTVAIADAATRVGAFPFGAGADSALIVNLAPGAYTAQVTGVAGTTGTTLLEVYELP